MNNKDIISVIMDKAKEEEGSLSFKLQHKIFPSIFLIAVASLVLTSVGAISSITACLFVVLDAVAFTAVLVYWGMSKTRQYSIKRKHTPRV